MPRPPQEWQPRTISVHGHDVAYRRIGEGPVLLLLHGMAGASTTWDPVVARLAERHTLVAPDLLGHGQSAKPRGDYSIGAYASGVRDLMAALDVERATFVGHSLGGGIAMQLAYQHPERCERLVLVASGGLGGDVHPLLRAIGLPLSELVLPLVFATRIHGAAGAVRRFLGKAGIRTDPLLEELWGTWSRLTDVEAQRALVQTIRTSIGLDGQRVSALDRLYLASAVPTMIVWGDRDRIIPVEHAHTAHGLIAGSRLEILERVGHFVPNEVPRRFCELVSDFVSTTEPACHDESSWRELLLTRAGTTAGAA